MKVRSSVNGVDFSLAELAASVPSGQSISPLSVAATTDGGGFVSFVRAPTGASAIGEVVVAAFGTQRATSRPGLGPLPGGGIGSAVGDQLATSTCQVAKFGDVVAQITAGCFGHDPENPNLDVTTGELNLNGLRIIPDEGTRIGVDPEAPHDRHDGKVRVVLSAPGIDITLWHDEIHVKIPTADAGKDLLDLPNLTKPVIKGFPVEGDIDVKLAKDGVDVPISLSLPKYFGGVTGSATLHATTTGGLDLKSLEFKVGDANLGALELKDVDVSYTSEGNIWKGSGELLIPAGGGALDAKLAVEFDDGKFKSGSLDVGLPYPGIPIDDTNAPPQLYLSHVGLGLGLDPLTFTGMAGLGLIPLKPPGAGAVEDYIFRLEGELSVAFGRPVTITVKATGFLYNLEVANSELTYRIPDQVTLTAHANYRLGILKFDGDLGAIIDAKNRVFGASIEADAKLIMPDPFSDVPLPGNFAIAFNNAGFGAYLGPPGVVLPIPPFSFFGAITYRWGDTAPRLLPYAGKSAIGAFKQGVPTAGAARRGAHAAAAASFTVPAGAPTASVVVHGAGGPPQVSLAGPDGKAVLPDGKTGSGEHAAAVSDAKAMTTNLGIQSARRPLDRQRGPRQPSTISSIEYAIGAPAPKLSATLSGKGYDRKLSYRATVTGGVKVTFAEQAGKLLHVIGSVKGKAGTIRFRPALRGGAKRKIVARMTSDGLPFEDQTLAHRRCPRRRDPGARRSCASPPPRAASATASRRRPTRRAC